MPKYLCQVRYTPEGVKGLVKEGAAGRKQFVEGMVKSLGGRMESMYFAVGDVDAYVVIDVPDGASANAMSIAVNQSGAVQLRTTLLITAEEMDAAIKKNVAYRAPGK